ncbi:hypothetical protein NDU88_013114 [Pleurodeles waltl]|uniref:Uncharacterized protein n=1 Tax=Pleurodeles waltl TaxID=8319 RepID=A0AAV7R230_PLEWA|nr:hypothetical protein NDU88_013114 [Pleurodeles waltl]
MRPHSRGPLQEERDEPQDNQDSLLQRGKARVATKEKLIPKPTRGVPQRKPKVGGGSGPQSRGRAMQQDLLCQDLYESVQPRACSREPAAESVQPRACSREPAAESVQPRACSRERAAESLQPRACSRERAASPVWENPSIPTMALV